MTRVKRLTSNGHMSAGDCSGHDTKQAPIKDHRRRVTYTAQDDMAQALREGDIMRTLREIAGEIRKYWENPYFGAVPYIRAMQTLDDINQPYGYDSGERYCSLFFKQCQYVARRTWRVELKQN